MTKKNGLITIYDSDGNRIEIRPDTDTDTTFTISGKAADAYEVGARLKETKNLIDTALKIAKGANQAISYENYEEMVEALNWMDDTALKKGQNIYIGTVGVPDLWIYSVGETADAYSFVDDNTFVDLLKEDGTVQVGYYYVAMLETQKVDLSEYAKTSDMNDIKEYLLNSINTNQASFEQFKTSAEADIGQLKSAVIYKNVGDNNTAHGRYIVIGDVVIALAIFTLSSSVSSWSISVGVPAPKYDSVWLKDVNGAYSFQVNPNGVFQNAQDLPAGRYVVNAIYIK